MSPENDADQQQHQEHHRKVRFLLALARKRELLLLLFRLLAEYLIRNFTGLDIAQISLLGFRVLFV
jgi:hypothetical protein